MSARRILRERTPRARHFPHLDETAWLMLVDLFVHDGRQVSITSACFASFAPGTTALMHTRQLEADGFVTRHPDENDRRRVWLRLTDMARQSLGQFFEDARSHNPESLSSRRTDSTAIRPVTVGVPHTAEIPRA